MKTKRTDINFTSLWFCDRPFVTQSGVINFGGAFSTPVISTSTIKPIAGTDTVTLNNSLSVNPRGIGSVYLNEYVMLWTLVDEYTNLKGTDGYQIDWVTKFSTEIDMMLPPPTYIVSPDEPVYTNALMRVPRFQGPGIPPNWSALIEFNVNLNLRITHATRNGDDDEKTLFRMDLKNLTTEEVLSSRFVSFDPTGANIPMDEHEDSNHSLMMNCSAVCAPGDLITLFIHRDSFDYNSSFKFILFAGDVDNTFDAKLLAILPNV